ARGQAPGAHVAVELPADQLLALFLDARGLALLPGHEDGPPVRREEEVVRTAAVAVAGLDLRQFLAGLGVPDHDDAAGVVAGDGPAAGRGGAPALEGGRGVRVDGRALGPGGDRLGLRAGPGGNDLDLVPRRGDVPVLPVLERERDGGRTDAGRLRGPNRAVEV